MVYTHLLLRTGEIFLKGKNRYIFEQKLIQNIIKICKIKVKNLRCRFITDFFPEHYLLQQIFGLTSYSPAIRTEKELNLIKKKALELMKNKKGTFKVETKRSDKTFPFKSPQINVEIGTFLEKNIELIFNLKKFDHKLNIEINQEGAYLFFENIKCFGGLPVGVEGKVYLLLENKASLLAGLMVMKRGVDLVLVNTGQNLKYSLLQKFSPDTLNLINLSNFNKEEIIISGENYNNYQKQNEIQINKNIILRPLIAYSDNEIENRLNSFQNLFL